MLLLMNHPSALAAALATGAAVSAAIINVAFDFFAGEEDGPGTPSIALSLNLMLDWRKITILLLL